MFQLASTEGWQNLQAILQTTGERIPKRPRERDDILPTAPIAKPPPSSTSITALPVRDSGEPLAKRFAAFRLNERRILGEGTTPPSKD